MIPEDVRLAVKKGAYWLDEAYPEWLGLINLEALDVGMQAECIIGQIAGSFDMFWREFRPPGWGDEDMIVWTSERGFRATPEQLEREHTSGGNGYNVYQELTEAWREYIQERRG